MKTCCFVACWLCNVHNCAFLCSMQMFMYNIDTVTSLFTEEHLGPDLNNRICVMNTVDVTFRSIKVWLERSCLFEMPFYEASNLAFSLACAVIMCELNQHTNDASHRYCNSCIISHHTRLWSWPQYHED